MSSVGEENPYQNPEWLGSMRITVDPLNSSLLPRLATPEARVRDEEQLLLRERIKSREHRVWFGFVVFLPCLERSLQAASIGNILAQRELSVDGDRFIVRPRNGIVGILVDETSGSLFKRFNSLIVPPVREVSDLIIVSPGRIESYICQIPLLLNWYLWASLPCDNSWPLTEPNAPYVKYFGADLS